MASQQELQNQIIEKAWADEEFKKKLIADPKAALKEAFDLDIPADINVEVLEETADTYYLVLPQSPSASKNQVMGPRWL
ncbi:NHLP leader peptide family RiPP precursor [Paenibacillus sp. CAU 1782]